jgi:molybdopterin synthase catalytic subunit
MDSLGGSGVADRESSVTWVRVSADVVEPAALLGRVADPGAGAVVLFLGTVRDHSLDRTGVSALEYEAYVEVVEGTIEGIVGEARHRWPAIGVAVEHRLGRLTVGEVAVGVAVSSAHRADAFAAGRYLIDELKSRAPIWKKEHWDGGAEWVREGDAAGA